MINNPHPLDRMFHALADSHRRSMIERLAAGPMTISDLAKPLEISLPAVMQHLAVLETLGIVSSEKQGRVRTCKLAPGVLTQAEVWLSERRMMMERRLSRLERYLDQPDGESDD
jgi:DNA-binding transcriptional ArsR family regulator